MSDAAGKPAVAGSERVAWIAALALLALRLFHLGGPLDDPHSWRQCDTARYSLEYARHGVDLLRPAVCWLGAHRILIFEFPLPEAISGLLQRAFGESVVWDRVVGLAFYVVATFYLLAFLRLAAGRRVAWASTLAWLALPLGQFYSRAAHVDFAALAGVHALLYHGARAARGGGWGHAGGGALAGAIAAMIKAPYLIPALGPLGLIALSATGAIPFALLASSLVVTVVAFKIWRAHVDAVNAAAPDWDFLPGYYKEVNPLWWYFGDVRQRFDPAAWVRVVRRLFYEVATPPGVLVAFAAPLASVRDHALRAGPRVLAVLWGAGVLLYLLVFFPLNVIHNYYQMPFLAPFALLIGLGFEAMWVRVRPAALIAAALFLFVALTAPARLGYYQVDWLRVEAGRVLDARLPKGELLVACDHASGYSDPRLLDRADRDGWSLAIPDLTPGRLDTLRGMGATHVAIVLGNGHPGLRAPGFLAALRTDSLPVAHAGKPLGVVEIFRLAPAAGPAPDAATGANP